MVERAEAFLPLNPRVYALLATLLEGPAHGYAIKLAVEERSDGRVRLDPGSLYRMISKLDEQGLIGETDGPDGETDARRRYYALTPLGRDVLSAETARLRALVGDVEAGLGSS